MGGSQSTRKVTVDNENAIQVSQEALDRIQSQLTAKQAEQRPPPPVQSYTPPAYEYRRQHEYAAEEAYWAHRIEKLKRAHEKINSGMHLEYQKTLKEANDLFNMVEGDKVLQCYSTNPNKSLLCSVLVNEFNDCVCKSRVAALTATS
ncbi:hypothetical protein SFRURICE_007196 [Spodoptera frugiperda]|nr:hypothetical protein SFRURICE_007196 [Spodoptera frugiperda]